MGSLIFKKLANMPIGTELEVTYEEEASCISRMDGIVTGNDFSNSLELTDSRGREFIMEYTLIRGVRILRSLDALLKQLKSGTQIRFSFGVDGEREPNMSGVILDNDFESSMEVDASGEELILNYGLVKSLLIVPGGSSRTDSRNQETTPARPTVKQLSEHIPEDILNLSDNALKQLFDGLGRSEKMLLSGAYDSFRFGIKSNSPMKMKEAAQQAKQIIFREANRDFRWSRDAARFCGGLLRRTDGIDHEVYLTAECFREAALACWRSGKYALGGAYAILSLLEEHPAETEDLAAILAAGVIRSRDISALELFRTHMDTSHAHVLTDILTEAFWVSNLIPPAGQTDEEALKQLAVHFPGTEMVEELNCWMPTDQPTETPAQAAKIQTKSAFGIISRMNWMDRTGIIIENNGTPRKFQLSNVTEQSLHRKLENCMRADLGGAFYSVKFDLRGEDVVEIRSNSALVEQARAIFSCAEREDRYTAAFQICRRAVQTGDARRTLGEMTRIALAHRQATGDLSLIQETVELCEEKAPLYPEHAFARMDLAQCYEHLNKRPQMVCQADIALEIPSLNLRQKIAVVSLYARMLWDYYQVSTARELCQKMVSAISSLERDYGTELENDAAAREIFCRDLLPYRVQALCKLNLPEQAEADLHLVPATQKSRDEMMRLVVQLRDQLRGEPKPDEEIPAVVPVPQKSEEEEAEELTEEDALNLEPIIPYSDPNGWAALHTTKQEVISYAISQAHRPHIMTAYLRAAAGLNPDVLPTYRMAALACNDPMESPDYSVDSMMNILSEADADYPVLNDFCIAVGCLRASFRSGRGYDQTAQGLHDSIGIIQTCPQLQDVLDTLEFFRREAGCAIDIYADYRNQDSKRIQEEMEATIAQARELYQKFIATPPRDGAKFARLLETKKIVFSQKGELASLLTSIMEQDSDALNRCRNTFIDTYLCGSTEVTSMRVSNASVDELIVRSWEEAGRGMQMKRFNATLQGDRRNNLRSNIHEILSVVHRWYILSEQDADMTWRTEHGAEAYRRLSPQLLSQLQELREMCVKKRVQCGDAQRAAGLQLLQSAAEELAARLDGSWKVGQEKYFYVDYLRTNDILLDEDYLPDLSATFCALPQFNILARIRSHAQKELPTFAAQINRIYDSDRTDNNYGTAAQIVSYLEAIDHPEPVSLPENAAEFLDHTHMYSELRYRSFRENYALALSRGRIIKTDLFCSTLEDTVRYWYSRCHASRNFGFFARILQQVEEQIHESARQYEQQLLELLEVLVERNPQVFSEHPGSEDAIRIQIVNQNFTVAEDWMARVRRGEGIQLETSVPEALKALDEFWHGYSAIYDRVANTRRPLASLTERREIRNKDSKWGQRLIEAWLSNGNPSNSTRITHLLNLLGWHAIQVERYHFAAAPHAEIYEVRREHGAAGLTAPLHPIAEFGTMMEKKPLYAVCLYGIYDCDRLYEKMRTLDLLEGNVLVLLDYALGQGDRRKLARQMKRRESSLRNKYLVVDRILLAHLADTCNEMNINRFLIALAAPFSYFQPYVVESADTMPPEIFIGRRDELMKVEQPNGVNLIYGGRQLGKSALFKKAVSDIDGRNGQRAVMVDINGLNCAEAAKKVSYKLMDLKILPQTDLMDDWDALCRSIERQLRSDENEITYFILMLDEADEFIKDCANNSYRPMVALKDVQQSLPGQFKYVLAGLHDIVKFNRQVALGNNSVITHMSSLKITPFRTEDARELLTGPLSFLGFSLPSEMTVTQILATCNYFPGLIQLYAKKLIESVRTPDYAGYDIHRTPPYVVSDEHLRRVMADKEFVAEIHNKFEATLTLDEQQDNYYYPLALLIGWMYSIAPSKSGYTARDVMYHAQDLAILPLMKLDEDRISALLQELQDLNILRSVTADSYLLASKRFRDLLGTDEEIFEKLRKVGGDEA